MDEDEFDIWTIVLPAVGMALAAFCIWLAVRIINRRERWAKWLAAGLMLLALYPLSFGPACWLTSQSQPPFVPPRFMYVYWPLGNLVEDGSAVAPAIVWWAIFGTREGRWVVVPSAADRYFAIEVQ